MPKSVVQKHHPRTHHFAFRLENEGVLTSGALPKVIPQEPGMKHLAEVDLGRAHVSDLELGIENPGIQTVLIEK